MTSISEIPESSEIVICGAGIAGVAAAYELSVVHGLRDILLVDEGRPLSLTSDKSTEAYRNWWPGPDDAMLQFMNRSIDLLENHARASDNAFLMNRRGYYYATADETHAQNLLESANLAERMGAGPLRLHDVHSTSRWDPPPFAGLSGPADGADFFQGSTVIHEHFPWLAPDICALLVARRCGWLSGQGLGMYLLAEARSRGVQLVTASVTGVDLSGGHVSAVHLRGDDGESQVRTSTFVNAAGPLARNVAAFTGCDLPLFSERHLKIAFEDRLGAIPRETGLVICEDPIQFDWEEDERAELLADPSTRWLAEALPGGVHMRPEGYSDGSQTVLVLWAYHTEHVPERFPVPLDADFPEVALRGMSRLVPGLRPYLTRLPKVYQDGGYYTKTAENRPIIGPTPVAGSWVLAGISGYGIMASCAAAELLGAHIAGTPLPAYAPAFALARYDDPAYQARLVQWGETGQL